MDYYKLWHNVFNDTFKAELSLSIKLEKIPSVKCKKYESHHEKHELHEYSDAPVSQMYQWLSSTKGDRVATGKQDIFLLYFLWNLTSLCYCSVNEHQFLIKLHKLADMVRKIKTSKTGGTKKLFIKNTS